MNVFSTSCLQYQVGESVTLWVNKVGPCEWTSMSLPCWSLSTLLFIHTCVDNDYNIITPSYVQITILKRRTIITFFHFANHRQQNQSINGVAWARSYKGMN